MEVEGTLRDKPVRGRGFVERHGFEHAPSLDHFFKTIGNVVLSEIDNVIPYNPTEEQSERASIVWRECAS